jgi:hypothetical protein
MRRPLGAVVLRIPRVGVYLNQRYPAAFAHWDRGLNGQRERRRLMAEVITETGTEVFVETGTFRGGTAAYVREHWELPVWTVELDGRSYEICRRRFRDDTDVHVHGGDSRDFLRAMTSELAGRLCLFYLDAHWSDDMPLLGELQVIAGGWSEYIVVIDDFEVPDDDSYTFEFTSDGRPVGLWMLPLDELPPHAVFFPAAAGSDENPPRRGSVLLGRGDRVVAALERCRTLRKYVEDTKTAG